MSNLDLFLCHVLAYVERPEVSVLLAVKHDFEILCANNMSQECEGALQLNTSCHNES